MENERQGMDDDFVGCLKAEIEARKRKLAENRIEGQKYAKRGEVCREKRVESPGESGAISKTHDSETHDPESHEELETKNTRPQPSFPVSATEDFFSGLGTDAMTVGTVSLLLLQRDPMAAREALRQFTGRLLNEWKAVLASRAAKDVPKDETIYIQTSANLRLLFKLIGSESLGKGILERVIEIVGCLQQREYVKANDAYLRLAIGNAAWPIGVTNVSIHERSAHAKIATPQCPHILNDETSRKWIQSIKRLMTFCQNQYPPDDSSKAMG